MTENDTPIEDRDANVRLTVSHIISSKHDEMFEQFDRLHRRNIHDDDVVKALRQLDEVDTGLLDAYAEWADIDIREDDNTTMNPVVPDPGNAPSYEALAQEAHFNRTGCDSSLHPNDCLADEGIEKITKAIIAELVVQREKDLYVDDDQPANAMMIDGYTDITAVAKAVVKALA